jgi:hypothetical protein
MFVSTREYRDLIAVPEHDRTPEQTAKIKVWRDVTDSLEPDVHDERED